MNEYKNKYFSVLGDSISTLKWYSKPWDAAFYNDGIKHLTGIESPSDTWWGQVIAHFGGELLVNHSFSGSMVTRQPWCEIESYGCSDERTGGLHIDEVKPDVIMVFMGINDWGGGARLLPHNASGAGDIAVFSAAYECMLGKLQKNYPEAEIWCFTLPVAARAEGEVYPYRKMGVHIAEFCDVILSSAKKYGCKTADLYRHAAPYSAIDGFHPNALGMKALSAAVIEQMELEKAEK